MGITFPWLYFTLLYITLLRLYFILLYSILLYHGTTSFYLTLHYSTRGLLHCTALYCLLPKLYFTLLDSTFPSHPTWLCITLPCLYFPLCLLYITLLWLYCTLLCSTLLYFALHYSTKALFNLLCSSIFHHGYNSLYFTLHYTTMAEPHSTLFFIILLWLYFTLL